eukprot:Amastigsp_a175910_80.p3 type:complete len:135 gc:universal Amastigsp_a175910_80:515-919(+)
MNQCERRLPLAHHLGESPPREPRKPRSRALGHRGDHNRRQVVHRRKARVLVEELLQLCESAVGLVARVELEKRSSLQLGERRFGHPGAQRVAQNKHIVQLHLGVAPHLGARKLFRRLATETKTGRVIRQIEIEF